jgi:ankyrin repeat protein
VASLAQDFLNFFFLQAGAGIHTTDKSLKTPLMVAAEYGHLHVLKMLVTSGARLHDKVKRLPAKYI